MQLTDDLLLDYLRCHRRSFLAMYGDPGDRTAPGDYLSKILGDSAANRRAVLERDPQATSVAVPKQEPQSAHEVTLQLMAQGVERIYQGTLQIPGPEGTTLQIRPDLLIRAPGVSLFGDWLYEPVQIKLSRRPKLEYQIVGTFQTQILAEVQGAWPDQAWLYLRDRDPFAIDLVERWEQTEETVHQWITMLTQRQEPELFIARSRCSLCAWYNHCHQLAEDQNHLSLLPGVTPRRYIYLQDLQLTTLEALHAVEPALLAPLPGFGPEVAAKLVEQARSNLTNRPIRPRQVPVPPRLQAPVELYFDIEAEPDLGLAYLHGVLVVDHERGGEVFYPFLAEHPDQEPEVWRAFLALVCDRYPEAPVYHFCSYEADTVRRLGQVHRENPQRIAQLLSRFVDMHYWVTQTVTMPVESYALKNIARWIGFDWRDEAANGAQAVFWYSQWLQTGDRSHLERILIYNEDDCRATYIVKEWLAEFVWDLPPQGILPQPVRTSLPA